MHSDEELWANIIVDNDIRCERNKMLALKCFEGKEVRLLLTRNFFDDDVDFECIAKSKKK